MWRWSSVPVIVSKYPLRWKSTSARPSEPRARRWAVRIIRSPPTPSSAAYRSTRVASSSGNGTRISTSSSIICTMRIRKTRSRRASTRASSSGPIGSATAAGSDRNPVIAAPSSSISEAWSGVTPSVPATAVVTARRMAAASSGPGGSRSTSSAVGNATGTTPPTDRRRRRSYRAASGHRSRTTATVWGPDPATGPQPQRVPAAPPATRARAGRRPSRGARARSLDDVRELRNR